MLFITGIIYFHQSPFKKYRPERPMFHSKENNFFQYELKILTINIFVVLTIVIFLLYQNGKMINLIFPINTAELIHNRKTINLFFSYAALLQLFVVFMHNPREVNNRLKLFFSSIPDCGCAILIAFSLLWIASGFSEKITFVLSFPIQSDVSYLLIRCGTSILYSILFSIIHINNEIVKKRKNNQF